MNEPIIEVRSLERTYRKGPRALDGVDLDVEKGARFALLGPNGAGKSTLTRILCTLSRADAGTVRICGIPSSAGSVSIRSRIGVALQDIQTDPGASVRDQLRFQGRLFGMDARRARERAEDLIDRFDLGESAGRKAGDLSGGTKRRLHVALALVHGPELLFLDEPTAGMDPEVRALFWGEILRRNREEGTTIFFTTQYLEEAERHAESLAVIHGGRIAYRGTPSDFAVRYAGTGGPGDLESGYLAFLETRRGAVVRESGTGDAPLPANRTVPAGRKEAAHA